MHIPQSVRKDVSGYRANVEKYVRGETNPVLFRGYRVPMGIYEQRKSGDFMVRIRIGAGVVLSGQLERISELSKKFGDGVLHVTTRQDIQIHEVAIENTPDVLEGLLAAGLTARGGGGNTVRNVTACPRAGVCAEEVFDVLPHSMATAEFLLQDAGSFNLPRKYKIVFSGCSSDCALASVADVGFFAHIRDGRKGFSVYAGGGLGPNATVGVKIEDFIEAGEIFEVAEAVKQLFDKHGDRANRSRARLRYVLGRVGEEEFVKLYRAEREALKASGLTFEVPEIRDGIEASAGDEDQGSLPAPHRNVTADKVDGRFTVRLRLTHGDVSADDLAKIADIARRYGVGAVRTTQKQDLLISDVGGSDVEKVIAELKGLSSDVSGDSLPKIVACTGAATCKLGLCLSRGLSDAISTKLGETEMSPEGIDEIIRISGCPNSCGHHYVATIGFQGRVKRVDGRLMPCYDVFAEARMHEGDSQLAERVGYVPARRIPEMVAEALKTGKTNKEQLRELAAKYGDLSAVEVTEDYYRDYGAKEAFSLAGRGPGECGASVMDVGRVDIDQAADAIKTAKEAAGALRRSEALYSAIIASSRALMIVYGLESKKDREVFAAFSEHLIGPGWVKKSSQDIIDAAVEWRMGDRESIGDMLSQVEELADRVAELFRSLDARLKFRISPIEQVAGADEGDKTHKVDLLGVACPLNFVKAKLALEKVDVGEVLEVLLDDGEPVQNVPDSFVGQGHEVVSIDKVDDHFAVKVRRKQ